MNFTAEYQLTFEEFREISRRVQQHYYQRMIRGKIVPQWIVNTIFVVGFLAFGFFLTHDGKHSIRLDDMLIGCLPLLGVMALWAFAVAFQRWSGRRTLRRAWETSPILHRPTTIHIHDRGIVTSQSTAQHSYSWQHFILFDETPTMFLLYTTDYSGLEIPKRIFDDPQTVIHCRDLLQKQISAMTQAFPVIPIAAEDSS